MGFILNAMVVAGDLVKKRGKEVYGLPGMDMEQS
jgi:hypothetical protein